MPTDFPAQVSEYIDASAPPIGLTELADRRAATAIPHGDVRRTGWAPLGSGRTRWLVASAVTATAALVAGVLVVTGGPGAAGRPPAASTRHAQRHVTPPARPAGSANPASTAPASLTAMVVVSRPGAFADIGLVSSGSNFLTCVSRLVCYAQGQQGNALDVVRTEDGGVTWRAGQILPALPARMQGLWDASVSCLTPLRCIAGYGTGILTTTDGFASVSFHQIVPSDAVVGEAACGTADDCVADVIGGGGTTTLAYSADGGTTWAPAAGPVLPGTDTIVQLRCDGDGRCVGVISGGDEADDRVALLGSVDGGRSWALSGLASLGSAQWIRFSCGGGQDCLYTDNAGGLAWLHLSASGSVSVTVLRKAGTGQTNVYQAVSCPAGPVCYAEISDWTGTDYQGTILVETQDSGRTWTSLGSPMVTGMPDAAISYLGCPVTAGCIGLGSNGNQTGENWLVFSNLHDAG